MNKFITKLFESLYSLRYILISFLIIISILFSYSDITDFDFISYDDIEYVSQNHNVSKGITKQGLIWAFKSFYAANWHPITWISHMIDCSLFGLNAGLHHFINLLFHIANSLLLLLLFCYITKNFFCSVFIAFLFAVHPIHVESVCWISERKDVLSTFFFLLTLIFYSKYIYSKKIFYYITSVLLFALGLMAKPMIVSLPFILLLLDFWPLKRFISNDNKLVIFQPLLKRILLEKLAFFILTIISCILTLLAQYQGNAIRTFEEIPFLIRITNAIYSYFVYFQKMLFPVDLIVFYPHPAKHPDLFKIIISLTFIILFSILSFLLIKKKPYFFTGWFWYIITLFPVIGIVQVGTQAFADRYSYIPLTGLFIIFAWIFYDFYRKNIIAKKVILFALIGIIILLIFKTKTQAGYWRNDLTLANNALSTSKNNSFAYFLKGNYYLRKQNLEDAHLCFYKSLLLDTSLTEAKLNIGWIYLQKRKYDIAIDIFKEVISKEPKNVLAHYNLATAYKQKGDFISAIKYFSHTVYLDSAFTLALYNLGMCYALIGNYNNCINIIITALKKEPTNSEFMFLLANCLYMQKKFKEAIQWYEKAIKLKPDFLEAKKRAGMAYDSLLKNSQVKSNSNQLNFLNTKQK